MVSTPSKGHPMVDQKVKIDKYEFDTEQNFIYLESSDNNENITSQESKRRLLIANKCYYGLSKRLKSHSLIMK